MTVHLHPEANAELDSAVAYLNGQTPGLGLRFLHDVFDTTVRIGTYELIGHQIDGARRRFSMAGWPYSIIYRPEPDAIYVIAVAHESRRPNYWRRRARRR